MSLALYNAGPELSNVELIFSSPTPGVLVNDTINIASIPAQSSHVVNTVNITTEAGLAHGYPVLVDLEVHADGSVWTWSKNFPLQASLVSISDLNIITGLIESGEAAEVEIELLNLGGIATGPMTLTPINHDLITFEYESLVCPDLEIDGNGTTENSLNLIFSEQIFPGELLELEFECTQENFTDTLKYYLQVGEINRYGPSQRDTYGYRMFDDFDLAFTKAPSYNWVELDPLQGGTGTLINMSDLHEEDDASRTINLPFPVTYYSQTYTQITVCTNGWAAFGDQAVVNFHNRTIPSPIGPSAMLAPFWDDLRTNPGIVLYGTSADADYFIIEWTHMSNLGLQNDLSFQIIIYNTADYPTDTADNDIKFQYQNYENMDVEANYSTIGIEAPDTQSGILISYNNLYDPSIGLLPNYSALLFSTDRGERLPEGIAALSSNSMTFVQNPWSTGQDSIVITNVGESPLAYNINLNAGLDLLPPAPVMSDQNLTKTTPDAVNHSPGSREGSDAYGYTWVKSTEDGAPEYNWIDIATETNLLPYPGDPDDIGIGPLSLGFEFPFYDDVFSEMYVSSNGTISFLSNSAPWSNTFLPSASAPAALLAPWWEDLNNESGGPQGTLYFWRNEFDQCIITWQDFPKWGTSDLYTFQVILDVFGKIIYQYETMDGSTHSSTVGQQNEARSIGLQIHYNEPTVFEAETAITINRPVPWFAATGWSGQIEAGESSAFIVNIQTRNLDPGHYEVPLTLTTSAANLQESDINVSLDIVLGQLPFGDLNGDYLVDLNDLMNLLDFVLAIVDMTDDQFNLADLSADEEVNVIDVILLLEEILDPN